MSEEILTKLENIELRLDGFEEDVNGLLEKYQLTHAQTGVDEHGCANDEYWDNEKEGCVKKCGEGKVFDDKIGECIDAPKTESSTELKGEGLTAEILSANDETPEKLKRQWEKEDRELSEVPTVS